MYIEQLRSGYKKYSCALSFCLSADSVVISNHPIDKQKKTIYDRTLITQILAGDSLCPFTRTPLQNVQLVSIQMEITMFLISAKNFLETLPIDTISTDDGEIKKDILSVLGKTDPRLIDEATHNLSALANDDEVRLSLSSIANLIQFGVRGDYSQQEDYLRSRAQPEAAESRVNYEDARRAELAAHNRAQEQAQLETAEAHRREQLALQEATEARRREQQAQREAAEARRREQQAQREAAEARRREQQAQQEAAQPRLQPQQRPPVVRVEQPARLDERPAPMPPLWPSMSQNHNLWFNQLGRELHEARQNPNSELNQLARELHQARQNPNSELNQLGRELREASLNPDSELNQMGRELREAMQQNWGSAFRSGRS